MTTTKVAVFGGAFDPPHDGHAHVAKYLSQHYDQVWVMPAYRHMYDKKMTSYDHRLQMCEILFQDIENIAVSDYEKQFPDLRGSFDILSQLSEHYPTKQFYFVIGQDNANTVEKWKNYQRLIQEFSFIILPRTGYPEKHCWYKNPPHQFVDDLSTLPEISSTKIRDRLKNNGVTNHLSPRVFSYIKNNKLYAC